MKYDYRTRLAWLTLQQEVIDGQEEWEDIEVGLFMHTKKVVGMTIRYANEPNTLRIFAGIGPTSQKLNAADSSGTLGVFSSEDSLQAGISTWIGTQKASGSPLLATQLPK